MAAGEKRHARLGLLASPASLGVLSMLFTSGVAAGAWWSITSPELWDWCHAAHGANVHRAVTLAFLAGLAVSALILVVRRWRRLLLGALVLGGASLSFALALVADDSATYRGNHCKGLFGGPSSYVERARVGYLYVLWGIALGMLLIQVGRVLRQWRRSGSSRLP